MANLYQGAYRATLDDNSDIEALEKAHNRNVALAAQGEVPSGDDEHDEVMAQAPKDAEEVTFKKRYSDLRRHMDKVQRENKEALAELKRQLDNTTKQELKLPTSQEEVEAWIAEHPSVAKIVQSIAMREADARAKELDAKFKQVEEREAKTAVEKAYAHLLKAVPDFDEIRRDDAFHDWARGKSKGIQYALYEQNLDWETVRDAVNLYKLETGYGKPKKKTENTSDAALSVPRGGRTEVGRGNDGGKRIWTMEEIGKLRPREYEMYEAEIEQARSEGRIRSSRSAAEM